MDFLYWLAALTVFHLAGATSILLISGRYHRSWLPEREFLARPNHLIGLGFLVGAAFAFTFASSAPVLLSSIGTALILLDVAFLLKAIGETA